MFTFYEVLSIAAIVFVCATIQSVAGFGFGLAAVPTMSIVFSVKFTVAIVMILGLMSSGGLGFRQRRDVDRSHLRLLSIAVMAGAPFGLLLLNFASEKTLKFIIAGMVFAGTMLIAGNFQLKTPSKKLVGAQDSWLGYSTLRLGLLARRSPSPSSGKGWNLTYFEPPCRLFWQS